MTGPERAIRWSTVAVVAGVALIAGWVSYRHALDVVRAHGETGPVALAYPGTIDGLIYAASMVLLDAARRRVPASPLARWLLGFGISATLFANVLAGARYGPLGAAVAAWPALALVGSYELLMLLIPGTARATVPPAVPAGSNGHNELAGRFRDHLERGEVPGVRVIKRTLGVGQARAQEVRDTLSTLVSR